MSISNKDFNAFRAQQLANTHDPLALMANTQTLFHPDQSSHITYIQHPQPNNNFVLQPSFNMNYMQQPMQNPKDISNPTIALYMTLELMSKAFQLNNTTTTNNNQRSSSNPCNSQFAQSGMNIDQDRHMLMVDDNVGNQFKDNAHGNGNVIAARAEGNSNEINENQITCYNCRDSCEETERANANCTLENKLQQASISGTQSDKAPVYDSDESAEYGTKWGNSRTTSAAKFVRDFKSLANEADESLAKHKSLEFEIEHLLRAIVSQDILSNVQNPTVVETFDLQTELKRTKERFENCIIKKENEYAKLWNDWYKKCEECKYDKILYDKAINRHANKKRKRLQAQLGDQKGKSEDTPYVSEQKGTTHGTSTNTKFAKQSILGKPPSSSRPKLYAVTPIPKSKAIPKIDESHALSKPVTSNSVPTPTESKVVKNDNVISPGIFRINPFKASRVENFVPNKHVKASARTKPIIVSQPHVITKNDVNSKTNGFSPKDVKSTTRTRRPHPKNNPKSDNVPFKSKSSCLSNKLEKIEENHRSLQSSNYPNHRSSECNNIKLAIRNEKSEKHKPKVRKPKKVRSKERLASPKPSTPRSCLRWSPTGRIFDLNRKIIATSESVCQSDCFKGDNACTSNPQEPINKRLPSSTFSMTGCQNWLDTLLISLLSEYKPKDKEHHGDNECDI
ncbi:hypothetical protein Tco_0537671 [Tanacetum coccineum]